jgi:hypothetical protein
MHSPIFLSLYKHTHTHTHFCLSLSIHTHILYDGTAINAPLFMKQLDLNGVFKKRIESSKKQTIVLSLLRKKIAHLNEIGCM